MFPKINVRLLNVTGCKEKWRGYKYRKWVSQKAKKCIDSKLIGNELIWEDNCSVCME